MRFCTSIWLVASASVPHCCLDFCGSVSWLALIMTCSGGFFPFQVETQPGYFEQQCKSGVYRQVNPDTVSSLFTALLFHGTQQTKVAKMNDKAEKNSWSVSGSTSLHVRTQRLCTPELTKIEWCLCGSAPGFYSLANSGELADFHGELSAVEVRQFHVEVQQRTGKLPQRTGKQKSSPWSQFSPVDLVSLLDTCGLQ